MDNFKAIADEDIRQGEAVIFNPTTGRVRKAIESDFESVEDRMKRIKQVDEKGIYLYPNEPENN